MVLALLMAALAGVMFLPKAKAAALSSGSRIRI